MVSVSEASHIILSNLFSPGSAMVSLKESLGRMLAEPVVVDRDLPPFNRVAMDGIAVSWSELQKGNRSFEIEDIQAAGIPQKQLKDKTKCMEVMTGAVLPVGTDVVIRYEDVTIKDGRAQLDEIDFQLMQNVHKQGIDARKGSELMKPGIKISSAEVALLASVGKSGVNVKSLPNVAIISTGDELVDVDTTPEPHQIRRSNSFALYAALKEHGIDASLYHITDDESELEGGLREVLQKVDVMILSGGISAGKFDFVPQVLEKLGVKKLFQQVSQRPGKPFWFGATEDRKTVFALPGNPVSTFMCFYRYIQPWLIKSLGGEPVEKSAVLTTDFTFQPRLTYFLQVGVAVRDGQILASPIPGGGSGDFANLGSVDGFLELPLEKSTFYKGEVFPYFPFR